MSSAALRAAPRARAAAAERAVIGRHLRRLLALPGTRLGIVGWPPTLQDRLFVRWHYWWQAQLLDCLVDAQLRAPDAGRLRRIRWVVRGHRLRNGWRWTNAYFDDMAWWGLALERAASVSGRSAAAGLAAPVRQLAGAITAAWSDDAGGGVPWRKGDVFRNTPANGPAAILSARTGNLARAAATADWIDGRLRMSDTDLIADGLRPGRNAGELAVDPTVYSYCQGVVLGAELELVCATARDASRIHRLVAAIRRSLATTDGVLAGHGGGNGGLFTGVLARYLAQIALRLPGDGFDDRRSRDSAALMVIASADSAWQNAARADGLPVFAADWSRPGILPGRGGRGRVRGNAVVASSREPERDLSVQLSGWMLMEAAALISAAQRGDRGESG